MDDWGGLIDAFQRDKFELAKTLLCCVSSSNTAKLTSFFVELLRLRSCPYRHLLAMLVEIEVTQTSEFQMLFRGNNVSSKVLSHFAKNAGSRFLDLLLRPLIRSLAMLGSNCQEFLEVGGLKAQRAASKKSESSPSPRFDVSLSLSLFCVSKVNQHK